MNSGESNESRPDLGQALKAAFDSATREHRVSRRAVAAAVYARQDAAYQLRKRNAPSHALAALPSPPRTIHTWENLFLRWFNNHDFPTKKDLEDVLDVLEERAPGSTLTSTRAQWQRIWQAGPTAPEGNLTAALRASPETSSEISAASPPLPILNQAGRDVIIHGGQHNVSGDQTIINRAEKRRHKD